MNIRKKSYKRKGFVTKNSQKNACKWKKYMV